jgi:di/tricarboxylate transporter
VITGGAFLALARSTGQRPTQWLGVVLAALGVLAAIISTQEASGFVSQGLLGLLCGVLVLVSAADRIGLLEALRDRVR